MVGCGLRKKESNGGMVPGGEQKANVGTAGGVRLAVKGRQRWWLNEGCDEVWGVSSRSLFSGISLLPPCYLHMSSLFRPLLAW